MSSVLLPLILAFIMFSLGPGLTPADFRRIVAQPRALIVGVFCHFKPLPLACVRMVLADEVQIRRIHRAPAHADPHLPRPRPRLRSRGVDEPDLVEPVGQPADPN